MRPRTRIRTVHGPMSKNIRKLGSVSNHDTAVMTFAPKMTLVYIDDPYLFPQHGPHGEILGTKLRVLTHRILDQADDWYPHARSISMAHSWMYHTRSYCGPLPNDGEVAKLKSHVLFHHTRLMVGTSNEWSIHILKFKHACGLAPTPCMVPYQRT